MFALSQSHEFLNGQSSSIYDLHKDTVCSILLMLLPSLQTLLLHMQLEASHQEHNVVRMELTSRGTSAHLKVSQYIGRSQNKVPIPY